jgi:hypothetical protein
VSANSQPAPEAIQARQVPMWDQEAIQARQRRKPVRCWFSGKKVPMWDQEAIQARKVLVWDQEAIQARKVLLRIFVICR